jgi:hypothetical protein
MATEYASFRAKIEAFLERTGMAESRFGRDVMRDSKFYYSLRKHKRSPTLRTVQRVEKFIDNYDG